MFSILGQWKNILPSKNVFLGPTMYNGTKFTDTSSELIYQYHYLDICNKFSYQTPESLR